MATGQRMQTLTDTKDQTKSMGPIQGIPLVGAIWGAMMTERRRPAVRHERQRLAAEGDDNDDDSDDMGTTINYMA